MRVSCDAAGELCQSGPGPATGEHDDGDALDRPHLPGRLDPRPGRRPPTCPGRAARRPARLVATGASRRGPPRHGHPRGTTPGRRYRRRRRARSGSPSGQRTHRRAHPVTTPRRPSSRPRSAPTRTGWRPWSRPSSSTSGDGPAAPPDRPRERASSPRTPGAPTPTCGTGCDLRAQVGPVQSDRRAVRAGRPNNSRSALSTHGGSTRRSP
jgi:hypothetical protein